MTAAVTTPPDLLPADAAALAYARRFNLVATDGSLVCIRGCGRAGTLPSLCCVECLDAHRRGWK